MHAFRALMARRGEGPFERTRLEQDAVLAMASCGPPGGLVAYVMEAGELRTLAGSLPAGAIIDRGTKHPARTLGSYLARRPGLIRLQADYRQPGQAERGVRSFLKSHDADAPEGRCFIGVPATVFEQLWARAREPRGPSTDLAHRAPLSQAPPVLQELIAIHPELRIPDSVTNAYAGSAPVVRLVHFLIVLAANCNSPVLIEGETGTGKEIVARQIHALRFGVNEKCVCVNCGGIPGELLESELFGHMPGAFTGALRRKPGLWEDARSGTLFLDEIGDLAPAHQVKVLRAIEDGTFTPVGGNSPVRSRARIVAATHQDLRSLVRAGRFREDLFHRLAILRIRTPALREHPEDIPAIARRLWPGLRLNRRQQLPEDVCDLLQPLPLPGNVRELRSLLAEIAMISWGKPITRRMARIVLRDRMMETRDD